MKTRAGAWWVAVTAGLVLGGSGGCLGEGGPEGGEARDAGASTDDAAAPDATAPLPDAGEADASDAGEAPANAPSIQDVLGCPARENYRLPEGDELHRVTLASPGAVCNDGTPALLFVRAATDPARADHWIFHLQGGGSCAEHDCAERWCASSALMSSMNAPAAVDANGIFSRRADNAFAGANHVYVAYCSSDNHAGTSGEVVIPASEDHDAFSVRFQGDAIVQAAASALEAGVTSDDGEETLPPLAPGGTIFLTGTSAGCGGVAHQADRLSARWAALGASTLAVCDSAFAPSLEDFETPAAREYAARLDEGNAALYEIRMRTQQLRLDESCVAAERGEPFRCSTAGHVLSEHVTDPRLFIYQDNGDSLFVTRIIEALGEEPTARRQRQVAAALEPASRAALARAAGGADVSVYGRTCRTHVGLTQDNRFFAQSVATPDGPLTYHDALVRWEAGETVFAIDGAENPSACGD